MQKLKLLIKNNKSNEIESYINNNNNIHENDIKNSKFDLLFFAIEKKATLQTIEKIINIFPHIYSNLNYIFRKHSPLSFALSLNNTEVANLLINFNARTNFYGHRFDNALFSLYRRNLLKESSLRFLIGYKVETYGSSFLSQLIKNDNSKFLDIFISLITPYQNKFIIDLLLIFKNKIPISKQILTTIIEYEKRKKYKAVLDDELINYLCNNSSIDTFNVLFKHKILHKQFESVVNYCELLNQLSFDNAEDKIKFLFEQGVTVNYLNSELLLNIIKNNNIKLAEYVIDKEIYINNISSNGVHLIWNAYELSHNDMLKLLIKHGADLFINDTDYENILKRITNDKLNILNILPFLNLHYNIYIGNLITNGYDSCKSTLVYAIENQNIEIVKHLLQTNTFHYCKPINDEKSFAYAFQNYKPELILACRIGNVESVELILNKIENINFIYKEKEEEEYYTPLSMASKYNNMELVEYLINHGAQSNPVINIKYKNYYHSALLHAFKQGNEDIVRYLIEKGAIVDDKDPDGKTVFIYACEQFNENNKNMLEFLLEKGADIDLIYKEKEDDELYTPLSMASKCNKIELVKFLLNYGAQSNPEITSKYKKYYKSALMHAFKQGNEEIVKCLIEMGGADINEKDSNGKSIFMYACENCSSSRNIIQFIINYGCRISDKDEDREGNNALHYICRFDDPENKPILLKMLIETYKFNINKQNHQGQTALHIASKMANAYAIRYLIEKGADMNIPDSKKFTPFVYACLSGNKRIVNIYAIKKGCNVNTKGYNGKNALIYAFEKGYMDIATYLIKNVSDIEIDLFCPNGNSILIYACQYECFSMVKYIMEEYPVIIKMKGGMIKNKLDQHEKILNAKGVNNKTAIMYACENGNYDITKYLIGLGAIVDNFANDGNTPLLYAAMSNNIEIVRLMLINSPKVIEYQNREGYTALSIAELNGNASMVKLIKYYINKINKKQ